MKGSFLTVFLALTSKINKYIDTNLVAQLIVQTNLIHYNGIHTKLLKKKKNNNVV